MQQAYGRTQQHGADVCLALCDAEQQIALQGNVFFLEGPAGSGKTELVNHLLEELERQGRSRTIRIASTGVAAQLIKHARTAHSFFRLSTNG